MTERDAGRGQDKQEEFESFISTLGSMVAVLGIPLTILAIFGIAYITMARLGPDTIYVNVHYGIFIAMLFFSAFLLDAVFFYKTADPQVVQLITISSFILFLMILAVNVTGVIADVPMSAGAAVSGNWANGFGNYTASVSDAGIGNFTGPLFFDMMEHVSLIGPGLAAVITVLIWYYKEQVLTNPDVKRPVLILLTIAIAWALILATMGVIMTKTLTYPSGV